MMIRRITACAIMIVTLLSFSPAFAEDTPGGGSVIADVILIRPLGIGTLVVGAAFFVVSLPFAVISGSTDKVANALVTVPFNFTFTRPLGENLL